MLGADHPDTLTSRNNLAGAYESAGRLDEAIALYRAHPGRLASGCWAPTTPTPWPRATTWPAPTSRRGGWTRRSRCIERTLADRERVLGADHPDTLASRNNLAGAYRSAGRLDEAIALFERTLADRERVLGADHPHTLTSRNNLAGAYESAGRLDEAIPLYRADPGRPGAGAGRRPSRHPGLA